MRILFCCTAAEGHFAPLVASAARDAGHEVAFATGPRFCERVRELSFEAFPVGIDVEELERRFDPVREELATLPPPARRARAYTGRFAEIETGSCPRTPQSSGSSHRRTLLPRASAVVAHGGSGSTLGALAHGTPLLLVPQGADQFENAAACAAAGAAITLPPPEQTAANLRAALERVLADRAYTAAAERVAAEVAELLFP